MSGFYLLSSFKVLEFLALALCLQACSDRSIRPPKRIPRLAADLPESTSNFYSYVSGGLPSIMEQYRFDINAKDLSTLEKMLWCRLGPETGAPSIIASVGTNTRDWYTPEQSRQNRSCESPGGGWTMDVLVDTTNSAVYRVFMVLSD
jgi:hypothetical protein